MAAPRRVVLSYFGLAEGERLVAAVRSGILPPGTPIDIGSYGIAPLFASRVAELPNVRYAPMFTLKRSGIWEGRSLPPADAKRLPHSTDRFAGPLPELDVLFALDPPARVAWATELGRRYRDAIRREQRLGVKIPTWQFDEVVAQAAASREWRDVVRGVLNGLSGGRQPLGDRPMRGVVYFARTALSLAGRKLDAELTLFWRSVDRASTCLGGEEFPDFVGEPVASARTHDAARRALARAPDAARQSLARKYVATLTPGLDLRPGLGGNVDGLPPAEVRSWRGAYIAARVGAGVSGIAEFDFRRKNGSATVIREVLGEIAAALA